MVRTTPRLDGERREAALVETLVIRPGYEGQLPTALLALQGLAWEWGLSRLVIPVNTRYWRATQALLRDGFRVSHVRLRMLYKAEPVDETVVNLASWAM
ncbi:MAG: hypothetical protein AB1700_13235 [Bacillota bacterium]